MRRSIRRGIGIGFIGALLAAAGAGSSIAAAATVSPLSVVAHHDGCNAAGSAQTTLTFNNPTGFAFAWEYRVDDQPANSAGLWPGVRTGVYNGVDYGAQKSVTVTYSVSLDQRLMYGAESDWFYDWVRIGNPCVPLTAKSQCRGGGWANYLDLISQAGCFKLLRA